MAVSKIFLFIVGITVGALIFLVAVLCALFLGQDVVYNLTTKEDVRIIIVGAGMAGLSAAQGLYEAGFRNITIFEASARVGGRIHTIEPFKDQVIDLGAQYIHGDTDVNPIYKLASDNGLLTPKYIVNVFRAYYANENGKMLSRKLAKSLLLKTLEIDDELSEVYANKTSLTGNDTNVYGYFYNRLAEYISTLPQKSQPDAIALLSTIFNLFRYYTGSDLRKIDSFNYGQFESAAENYYMLQEGFYSLIEVILNTLPKDIVRTSMPVFNINWDGKEVIVTTVNGDEYMADHVIVTPSLGYLRMNHRTLFTPPLPVQRAAALDKVGFGTVNKIIFYYNQPFWTKGKGSTRFAWTEGHRDASDVSQWYKAIHGFDETPNNDHILIGVAVDVEGKHLETLSLNQTKHVCLDLIRRFRKNDSIPEPDKVFVTNWFGNQWTLGSYTYLLKDSEESVRLLLKEALYRENTVPVVLFAGETYHMTRYSTADGARSSGLEQAQLLKKFWS